MATKTTKAQKLEVRGIDGKDASIDMPSFLTADVSDALVAQVMYTTHKRMRVRRAHTKERAEVRGGGRKPWRQKGTGRARHASTRSPIWVGGGITFGPRSRKERIVPTPTIEKKKALCGALTKQAQAGAVFGLRVGSSMPEKTKDVRDVFASTPGLLVILDDSHIALAKAVRNLPGVRAVSATRVSTIHVARASVVWIDEAAISTLESRCK